MQVGQAGRDQLGTWSVAWDLSLGLWDPQLPRPCSLCPWESREMLVPVGAQSALAPGGWGCRDTPASSPGLVRSLPLAAAPLPSPRMPVPFQPLLTAGRPGPAPASLSSCRGGLVTWAAPTPAASQGLVPSSLAFRLLLSGCPSFPQPARVQGPQVALPA